MRIFKHPLWSRFTAIAWPFFVSEARTKAISGLAVLTVLLLAVNGMNFINSYVMRDFMTALEQRHAHRFFLFGLTLAGVFGLAAIGEAFQFYTEQRMGLVWREWLTRRLLDRYLAHRAYHRLTVNQSIDNPDERISEDVKTFTTSSLSFIVLLLNAVLTLSLFLGVLWSITPWLVLTAVVYSAAGSLGTILLARRLVPLNNHQLQKEADFRFALGRVRERGESGRARRGEKSIVGPLQRPGRELPRHHQRDAQRRLLHPRVQLPDPDHPRRGGGALVLSRSGRVRHHSASGDGVRPSRRRLLADRDEISGSVHLRCRRQSSGFDVGGDRVGRRCRRVRRRGTREGDGENSRRHREKRGRRACGLRKTDVVDAARQARVAARSDAGSEARPAIDRHRAERRRQNGSLSRFGGIVG